MTRLTAADQVNWRSDVRMFAARLLAEIPDVEDLEYEDGSEDPLGHYFALHLPMTHDEDFAESVIALARSTGLTVYDPQLDGGEDREDDDWTYEIVGQASGSDIGLDLPDADPEQQAEELPYLLLIFDPDAAQATGPQIYAMVARNPYAVRAGKSRRVTQFPRRLEALLPDAWELIGLNFARAADYTNYILAYLPAPDGGSARLVMTELADQLGLAVHDPQADPSGGGPAAFLGS